ncbi:MAG: AmmeMemoRadiSam system protein B [Fusobacteriota bacterium]
MSTRKAAVAGKFYPSEKKEIKKLLDKIKSKEKKNINYDLSQNNIIGGVVPHAGYQYSGYEAIHFFELIKNKSYDTIIILNPNHTGFGEDIAMSDYDNWETPMGEVALDIEFTNHLNFPISNIAHANEHSGEVMIPFLQYSLKNSFKIIPITMGAQNLKNAKKIANQIYEVNKKFKKNILIIASSDFTHYQSPEEGKRLDNLVVEDILNFETEQIFKKVKEKNLTICGFGPIITLLEYSKLITKDPEIKLLKRGNSGDVVPSKKVVDYISFLVYKK